MLGPVFLCSVDPDEASSAGLLDLAGRLQDELSLEAGRRDMRVYTSLQQLAPEQGGDEAVQLAVEVGAVMVPVVTPSFLVTPWTRHEVLAFDRLCRKAGQVGLIVPVMWDATPLLDRPDDDEVATLLKARQYVDMSELRWEDWSHPGKKRALANLARSVLAALKRGARGDRPISVPPATPLLRLPPRPRPSLAAERDLAALLARMYTATELRLLPGRLPQADRLGAAVPARHGQAGEVAAELVRNLSRLSALDADLFELLRRERPLRRVEIDALAARVVG